MDIIIAAEKPSIAALLSQHMRRNVTPDDIRVTENPDETGSFYIGFDLNRYIMAPDGRISSDETKAPAAPRR